MQDYLFRDPVVFIRCHAFTGAVAATARDRGVCEGLTETNQPTITLFREAKLQKEAKLHTSRRPTTESSSATYMTYYKLIHKCNFSPQFRILHSHMYIDIYSNLCFHFYLIKMLGFSILLCSPVNVVPAICD